jgi:hypothetical protein
MFAYDRDDGTLVIGAGIKPEWVTQPPGVTVKALHTHGGLLNYTMRAEGKAVRVRISGTVRNAIIVSSPLSHAETRIETLPAELVVK